MALLICVNSPNWMRDEELHEILAPLMPGVELICGFPGEPLPQVSMLAITEFSGQLTPMLPNLRLVQKLGAGVETMALNPDLPKHVRIARLSSKNQAREIAEYCLAYVLRGQRRMAKHEADQRAAVWDQYAPKRNNATTVGMLGLGTIGGIAAELFAHLGFKVVGWSRSPKDIAGVDCRNGMDALPGVLAESDYICAILPQTPETVGLFDAAMLGHAKLDATVINAGRGTLIVDGDLIAALDSGRLGHAVLDVFREEPLPADNPFWRHPKVTVTPHVSGWNVDDCMADIAKNYRRLMAGAPLLNEVDRAAGY